MPNRLLVFMNRKVLIEFSELCNFKFKFFTNWKKCFHDPAG